MQKALGKKLSVFHNQHTIQAQRDPL